MLLIDSRVCTLCQVCINNCPFGALEKLDNRIQVNDRCTLCGSCVNVCRFGAIQIERKQASKEELEKFKGVFVWVELEKKENQSSPKKVSFELLSKGRELADQLEQELTAVIVGGNEIEGLDGLGQFGVDRVLLCQSDLLTEYSTDGFANVLCAVITQKRPAIVLYGATHNGRDLAPRVAARLHLGLTADCTGLEVDSEGQLVQTRPAFGGNIMASIITPDTRPQTATVRPNVFPVLKNGQGSNPQIENFPVVLKRSAIRTRLVERIREKVQEGENICESKVIVAGGRGCQSAENIHLLEDLAKYLGGSVAGSRAIVEQGWIDHTRQVGQSGTTVAPDLYIAVGISGAIQHIVGMSSSKKIIAINKDGDAPIFKIADLGIVGNAVEILPQLNQLVRQALDKANEEK